MKYNSPTLTLLFKNGATYNITSEHLIKDSISISTTLMKDLRPASSRCSLKVSRDCPNIEQIIGYNDTIKATLKDGEKYIFTGYLSSKFNYRVTEHGAQVVDFTIEDIGTRALEVMFSPSNGNGKLVNGKSDTIISSILNTAGIIEATNSVKPSIDIVKNIEASTTCKEALDDIMFECGYVYTFNEMGQFVSKPISTTSTPVKTINSANLYSMGSDAISVSKSAIQIKKSRIKYETLATKNNTLVYQDISGRDEGHPYANIEVQGGYAYPSQLTIDDHTIEELTSYTDATDLDQGFKIYYIDNVQGSMVWTGGSNISYDIKKSAPTQLSVLVKNEGASATRITRLEAKADVCYVKSTDVIVSGDTDVDEKIFEYECSYIHDKTNASRLASLISQYYTNSNINYSFYTDEDIELGSVIQLTDNVHSGLNASVIVTSKSITKDNVYTYGGVSLTPFDLSAEVDFSSNLSSSTSIPGLSVSEDNVWVGQDNPNGDNYVVWVDTNGEMSEIPIQLFTLECSPLFYELNSRGVAETDITVTVLAKPSEAVNTSKYSPVWEFVGEHGTLTMESFGWQCNVKIPRYETTTLSKVRCTIEGLDTVEINIEGKPIEEPKPRYWGRSSTTPSEDPLYPFMDGDYFLDISIQSDGKYNNVPMVRKGNNWYVMTVNDISYAQAMLDCGSDILKDSSSTNAIRQSTIIYAFIKNLMAENVVADNLFAKDIQLFDNGTTQGQIRSQGYVEGQSNKGFIIKQDGSARFVDVIIDGTSTIGGNSEVQGTIINRDSSDNIIFRTNKSVSTTKTISGSSNNQNPSAVSWAELKPVLLRYGANLNTNNTPLSAYDSYLNGRSIKDIANFTSVSTTEAYTEYKVSSANETKTYDLYVNSCKGKTIYINRVVVHRSVDWNFSTSLIGSARLYLYNRNTGAETEIYYYPGGKTGADPVGTNITTNNVAVPSGCTLRVTIGAAENPGGLGSGNNKGSATVYYIESENWVEGINIAFSDGTSMLLNDFIPNTGYATEAQKLISDASVSAVYCPFTVESTWPSGVYKYYSLHYTSASIPTTATEASFFSSKSLTIDGNSYEVGGIIYSRNSITMFTSAGAIKLSGTDYLRSYSFNFNTISSPQGAYAKNLMPTTTTSSIGGSGADSIWNDIYGNNIYYKNLNNLSKAEYKDNIQDFTDNSTDIINSVSVKSFVYKDDADARYQIGFLADDTDWRLAGKEHDRMDISNCIGVLIKAFQELSERIKELESQH